MFMKTELAIIPARRGTATGRKPCLALFIPLIWAAALMLPVFGARAGVVLTTLHTFHIYTNGANPVAGLVQDSAGNFYGTTETFGMNGYGTVFKLGVTGEQTNLHSFTGGDDGGTPRGKLAHGGDGNFYGTTQTGGTNGAGTVFRISPDGELTKLYSFTGGNEGGN